MIRTPCLFALSLVVYHHVMLPVHAQFTTVINVPPDPIPHLSTNPSFFGIDTSNTQLNVLDGGVLPSFYAGRSDGSSENIELNVLGGSTGFLTINKGVNVTIAAGEVGDLGAIQADSVTISGGTVRGFGGAANNLQMSGGTVGGRFGMFGSTILSGGVIGDVSMKLGGDLLVTGGSIGDDFRAQSVDSVTVSGGVIGDRFIAYGLSGSTATITFLGGTVGDWFEPSQFSTKVIVAGGAFGDHFSGVQDLSGNDFRLDGVPFDNLNNIGDSITVNVPGGTVLSGTLSDGTPFAFSTTDGDRSYSSENALSGIVLRNTALPTLAPFRTVSATTAPILGVRGGEELVVDAALGNHFNAGRGSIVTVLEGGAIGRNFEAVSASVHIDGGTVDEYFEAIGSSHINIHGGMIGVGFKIRDDSIVSISGGTLEEVFVQGGIVNISGGTIVELIGNTRRESQVNIWGGEVGITTPLFSANFIGTAFSIEGQPIQGLVPGVPVGVDAATGLFTGTLADGTMFSHDLSRIGSLTVTLVPEPTTGLLLLSTAVALMVSACGRSSQTRE